MIDMLGKIAHKFMDELTQRLAHKDIKLEVSDAVYRSIATQGVGCGIWGKTYEALYPA